MKKGKEIKIRVAQDDFEYIDNLSRTSEMSKSECIRKAVRRGNNQLKEIYESIYG